MRVIEQGVLDVLGILSPLGILALMVYLGFRMFDRLVMVLDKHLEEIEKICREYLDIIRPAG